jgi:hypothetical protein
MKVDYPLPFNVILESIHCAHELHHIFYHIYYTPMKFARSKSHTMKQKSDSFHILPSSLLYIAVILPPVFMQFPIIFILDVHMKDQKSSYVVRCITSYVISGHPEYSIILHIHNIWQDWSIVIFYKQRQRFFIIKAK